VSEAARAEAAQSLVGEILDLRCLDPAMGSGHFLVEATEYLARALATDPYVETEAPVEEDLTYWKRQVVERCIYGVDKNPLAVELAKLSLWLATVAADRPLSFLDHHLKCGDSLIGARVDDLGEVPAVMLGRKELRERKARYDAGVRQANLFETRLAEKLPVVMGRILEITGQESKDYDTVRAKEAADQAVRELKAPFEAVANLWTSAYFGNEFISGEYDQALMHIGQPEALMALDAVQRAQKIAQERRFFHWELAFPEVFYNEYGQRLGERAGFDAVVGNPPYGMTKERKARGFINVRFRSSEGRDDVYKLFTESAFTLASKGGYISYIIPNTILTNLLDAKLRKMLLTETTWLHLATFGYPVFEDPTVHSAILVVRKAVPEPNHRMEVSASVGTKEELLEAGGNVGQLTYTSDKPYLVPVIQDRRVFNAFARIEQTGQPLGEIAHIRQCIKTGDNDKYLTTSPQALLDPWVPVLDGSDIGRYAIEWPSRYLKYGSWLARNWQNPDFFERPKILIRETSERITASLDIEEFYLLSTLYSVYYREDFRGEESLHYLLALLNGNLAQFYMYHLVFSMSAGAFVKARGHHYARLPIRRIDFTTPAGEREALVGEAKVKAKEAIQTLATSSVVGSDMPMDRAVLAQAASPALSFVEERLAQEPEQADVIHDLLALLAGQMIEMHKEKRGRVEDFWLDLEGVTDAETFDVLRNKGKWESTLSKADACRPFVDEESRSTRHLDESLGWSEDAFKAFVKALAGKVQGLSDLVDVYRAHSPAYRALLARIEATDWLIDQIVYRLYGLTEDEIAIVEGRQQ